MVGQDANTERLVTSAELNQHCQSEGRGDASETLVIRRAGDASKHHYSPHHNDQLVGHGRDLLEQCHARQQVLDRIRRAAPASTSSNARSGGEIKGP